jgi:hypothetical protein
MGLRIRFQYQTGSSLGYSVERLADGLLWDFAAAGAGTGQTFTANPSVPVAVLPEDTGNFVGRFRSTLSSTPGTQFTDGDYCVTIHNAGNGNMVVGELVTTMHGGDDAPYFPAAGGGSDPWSTALPGSYGPGTAGAILGNNLDAKVSSRSTYAGGPVASVVAPVTVGVNNDKSGYSLASAGLDAISIETGVNLRQALSPILAVCAGTISGAGTGTIVVKGGNVTTTRLVVIGDGAGNRTSVNLALPA